MNGLISTAGRRFYFRHPWQLVLAITGIALGVAVYVGVDLANDSARRGFELSSNLVLGRTTHQLVGTGGTLAESTYRALRLEHGILRAAPVIEDTLRAARQPRRRFTLLGVDPFQEGAFRGAVGPIPGEGADFTRLMVEPGSVLVSQSLADEFGLAQDSMLDVLVDERLATVRVLGTLADAGFDPSGSDGLILADIATTQELLGLDGVISRVDLILTPAEHERLESLNLPGTNLLPASSRNASFNELTRAFRVNLTALSLLALMVGIFLIYATMSFAIVQRRAVIGVLRALGVGRRELIFNVLLEASVLGTIATVIGLVMGRQMAQGLVDLVLRTIGDLYFTSTVTAATPSAAIYWKGAALGLGATLVAAVAPALDAANTPPGTAMSRAALERGAYRLSLRAAVAALPVSLAAIVLLLFGPKNLVTGFAGLFFVLAAGALLTPLGTAALMKLAEPLASRVSGISGTLAVRGVTASLSRTGVATAALAVAVATVIGVGVMIASFRVSVVEWLDRTLVADIYLRMNDGDGGGEPLNDARLAALERLPEVAGLSVTRFVRLPTRDGELSLRAMAPGPSGWGLTVVGSAADEAIAGMEAGAGILISEPLAFRRQLGAGDELTLPTDTGPRSFPILGVVRDYNTDGGAVTMSMDLYARHWADGGINGVGIYLAEDATTEGARAAIQSAMGDEPALGLLSNRLIRERSLAVFDRTFQITEVLRILAGLVAFLGILSALTSLQLERAREIAILRALGVTPRQVGALGFIQTGLLGLAAGILAAPLGVILAGLLIFVINQRSFGWSMGFVVQPQPVVLGILLAVSAALLAGLYPATRAGRLAVAVQLREE